MDAERAKQRPDESEIVNRVAQGDRDAYALLYDAYAPRVYGLIVKLLGPGGSGAKSEADDILQDVMFELWRNASKYNPEAGTVATWVLLIARSRTIDHVRKRRTARGAIETMGRQGGTKTETAERAGAGDMSAVLGTLNELPSEQATALTMAFAMGMTREQIAAALDVPVGTVKTRVRAAVQRLAKLGAGTEGGRA